MENKMEKYKVTKQNSNNDILEFVSAVITNKQGNVLLLKRKDTLKLDPGKYDMCSGHIKQGEACTLSMLRELKEEIGVEQNEIYSFENIGTIPTPHRKFLNTKCHMYHIVINLTQEQINEKIKQVPEPEMQEAVYLESVDRLRDLQQKEPNLVRTLYNEDVEKILKIVEERIRKINSKEEKTEEER